MSNMPIIKDYYINPKGVKISNIRNISYNNGTLYNNLGVLVEETKKESNVFFDTEFPTDGVYIYKSKFDPSRAFRIYKDYADYRYSFHYDDFLVFELTKLQSKIKLSEFPTGIVTYDGYVIGQEIPYYENSDALYKKKLTEVEIKEYYAEILEVITELLDNHIFYFDIHEKNFLIWKESIKLIDFDPDRVKFECLEYEHQNLILNLIKMLNRISEKNGFCYYLDENYTLQQIKDKIKSL